MSSTPTLTTNQGVTPTRHTSSKWIPILLGGALPAYVLWTLHTLDGALTFDGRTMTLMALAVLTEFGAKWAFAELFRDGTLDTDPIRRRSAMRAALVGTGVARLIPAGGVITPAAMAWSVGKETTGTTGAALRATVLNYGGLILGAGAGLLITSATTPGLPLPGAAAGFGAGAVVFGASIIGASTRFAALTRLVPRRFRPRLDHVLVEHRIGKRALALLAARVLLEAATLGFTLRAFAVSLPPSGVLATFGLSQVAGGLPGPPGGLGLTEFGLVGTLSYLGVPRVSTTSAILVFRIVSYWMPAVAGMVASVSSAQSRGLFSLQRPARDVARTADPFGSEPATITDAA